VRVDAVTQIGKDETFNGNTALLNDRPPLLLEGAYLGNGAPFPIAVLAVHQRSLSGIEGSDGARIRAKRFACADRCLGTKIPESVPTEGLGTNRWALVNGDLLFDTLSSGGTGPGLTFTVQQTAGCSCEQIIVKLGLGNGQRKNGCSTSTMQSWISQVAQ
jgi:hypothetical protein